ncbi:MAG TPA: response regulator [Usitatibacteraceae bacterium]|nr:response regulator [Usitatibacteraceae bacterium]
MNTPVPQIRALVIDDEETSVEQLCAVLGKLGFATEVARDGLDGLQRCQTERYDVIFCDVRMPRLSGLSFLTNLARSVNALTRVVMVTALDDASIRRQALQSGASAYLVKPLDGRELVEAIALPQILQSRDLR